MKICSSQAYLSYPSIDKETLVFTSAGSVWQVNRDGGLAKPLVRDFLLVGTAVIDSARQYLAFAASDDGVAQIYWQSSSTETPKRMTNFRDACRIRGWSSDGRLLFTTSSGNAFRQNQGSWLLDLDTGQLEQQQVGTLSITHCASDGTRIAGPSAVNPRYWQSYKGGASGEIWIDNRGDGNFRPLPLTDCNVANPVLFQDRVWCVLDRKGSCNVYSTTRSGEDLRQHTRHDQFPVHSLATDGTSLVYCSGGELFLWATDGTVKPIVIEFSDCNASVAGKTAAVSADLRLVDGRSNSGYLGISHYRLFDHRVAQDTLTEIEGVRDCRDAACLADGRLLVVAAGQRGDRLLVVDSDRTGSTELLPDSDLGRITLLTVARLTPFAVVANHRHQLLLVDVAGASVSLLDRSDFQPIQHADLSADGSVCVYSVAVGQYRTVLRLVRTTDSELVAETDPDLADFSPRFQHDDSVVFLSMYPPASSGTGFSTAVYTLRHVEGKNWPSSGLPLSEHELRISRIKTPPVAFTGLLCAGRHLLLQLPPSGGGLAAGEDRNIGELVTPLNDNHSVWVTMAESAFCCGDHAIAIGIGEDWFKVQLPEKQDQQAPNIQPIGSREMFKVSGELSAAFCVRELLQLVGQYVSPDIVASVGWDSVTDRYLALARLPITSHEIDVLLNEILGFLASSHAHVSASKDTVHQRAGSPNINRETLHRQAGDSTETRALAYAAWVQQRRRFVRQQSGGTVDYYHLPDVSEYSRSCFEHWLKCRDMSGQLILDVRYNDGGVRGADIAQLLLNRPLASVATRRSRTATHPVGSVRRNMVLLANRFTSSGGELLIAALRHHAGSVIIGERTYGGGIGNTFGHPLPNSSSVLLPELLIKSPEVWSVIENHGVAPDIVVAETSEFIDTDLILRSAVTKCLSV